MNDIKDALARIAHTSAPAPLALDDVRGRARQIRRRRTATALVGTAAAVAAIAGLGVAVMPSDSHDDSLPPASQTPSVTPSRTPSGTPTSAADPDAVGPVHHVTLDVPAEQTFGDSPRVPYWSDGQIVDTDGTATPFPGRPSTFAKDPATGDWVVVRLGEANAELVRVDVRGKEVGEPALTFAEGLAVGPRGELATVTQHNTDRTLTEGDRVVDLGAGDAWVDLHGVLPNGDVLFQGDDGAVNVAHMDSGQVESVPGTSMAATSRQAGFVSYGLDDGTWRTDDRDGATRWTLDWAGVSSFSPDGRYVALVGDRDHRIAGSADWDSNATSTIWLRTAADLLPVAAFTAPEGGYFWNWTWDGDEVLATVFVKGEWSLVRLSADGFTVGRGTTRPGRGEEPAYVFAAQ